MQIRSVQILRAIACIYVCLQHITVFNKLGYGAIGVDIFFVLSGFLTARSLVYKSAEGKKIGRDYFLRKMLKILPLYYVGTLLVFCVGSILPMLFSTLEFNITNLIYSLLLIPGHTFYLFPGWTLTFMFLYWLIVYLCCVICGVSNAKKTMLVIIGVIILGILAGNIVPEYGLLSLIKEYFPLEMVEFCVGMLLYQVVVFFEKKQIRISQQIYITIFVGMTVLMFFFDWDILEYRYAFPTLCVAITIFCIYFIDIGDRWNLLVCIGNISFTIYIIHPLIIRPFDKLFINNHNLVCQIVFTIIAIDITVLVSYLVNKYFEKPLYKFCKERILDKI